MFVLRFKALAALGIVLASSLGSAGQVRAVDPLKTFTPNNGCRNTGPGFDVWLVGFRKQAVAAGVSARTVSAALDGLTLDQATLNTDRGQSFFHQSFLSFYDKLATKNRLDSGQRAMQRHKALFERAEQQYGVPAAPIAALWALESDFGAGMGKKPTLAALAALAWDCRRGEMFREELMAALRVIDRGDLTPADMIGSWAGELGQTQFLPSHYLAHAVDFDGDGRRDLMKNPADIIGSSAALLAALGWRRGEPWLEEVRLPAEFDWSLANIKLDVEKPLSFWSSLGVTRADGRPLGPDTQPTSLVVLMGRNGPAFLAYPNYRALLKWNQALNYATTAAVLANRIAGGSQIGRGTGTPIVVLETNELRELQALLARHGLYTGEQDGRLGFATRSAIKEAQLQVGLPADSYPSPELVERLRARR
jgi:lytic murein transglycosylase